MNNALSVGSFISFGWQTFKKRPWFLIGAVVLLFIAQMCINFLVGIIDGLGAAGHVENVTGIVSFLVSIAGQMLVTMSFLAFFLRAHDSIETVQVRDAWHPKSLWKFIGMFILLYIILIVGFILLVVPGIIAMLAFMFAPYLVVDKGLGPIEALKESARITKGNRWRLLALSGAVILISLLGFVALIVGILVAVPVTYLAYVHAYRVLSAASDHELPRQKLTGGEIALLLAGFVIPVFVGILAAIVLASLNTAQDIGSAAVSEAQLKQTQLALEVYYSTQNSYPATLDAMNAALSSTSSPFQAALDYSKFTYTPSADQQSYQLCAVDPVPAGDSQCVSSEDTATTTPQ